MKYFKFKVFLAVMLAVLSIVSMAYSKGLAVDEMDGPKRTYKKTPENLLTNDEEITSVGTFKYFDGMPDDKSAKLAYDELDKLRARTAYVDNIQLTSLERIFKRW